VVDAISRRQAEKRAASRPPATGVREHAWSRRRAARRSAAFRAQRPGGRARRWRSRSYWAVGRHSRALLPWTQGQSEVLRLCTLSASTVRPARALAIFLAVAFTVLLTALFGQVHAANPAATLGVYAGSGSPDAVAAFEARLGRNLNQVHDYQPKDRWSSLADITWPLSRWNASRYAHRVTYSIPMLPDSGGTLAEGAAGVYNAHFRNLALALVAAGDRDVKLRLGWEFNGNWFKWSIGVPNGAVDYGAYWRQIVKTMRSVPGASFKFDWCANNGSSYVNGRSLDAASAYPGDAYVDYIGMDVYDQSWSAQRADPSARWNEYVTRKDGLEWQRAFAAAHRKQISFPEWGIGHRTDGYGGGDSPYFIERMYEWIRTNPVAYHDYFEFADSVLDARLFGGRSPKASARFIELFAVSEHPWRQ